MLSDKTSGVLKWHRTWNLPSISVLAAFTDKSFKLPKGLTAQLFAVKLKLQAPSNKNEESPQPVFENIGLTGQDIIPLNEKGHAILSGLKLKSTSFNHENQFFYLVTVVYAELNSAQETDFDTESGLS